MTNCIIISFLHVHKSCVPWNNSMFHMFAAEVKNTGKHLLIETHVKYYFSTGIPDNQMFRRARSPSRRVCSFKNVLNMIQIQSFARPRALIVQWKSKGQLKMVFMPKRHRAHPAGSPPHSQGSGWSHLSPPWAHEKNIRTDLFINLLYVISSVTIMGLI